MIRGSTRPAIAIVLALAVVPHVSLADEPAPPAPAAPEAAPEARPEAAPAARLAPPAAEVEPAPVGDRPVLRPVGRSREIVIEVPGERSLTNKLAIGGIAGAGLLAGTLGLFWHLDSRDASNEVSATRFINRAWTPADAELVARADRSKTRATVAYVVGGVFVLGAVAAYIITNPDSETAVIRTGAVVVPIEGGALATKAWSF